MSYDYLFLVRVAIIVLATKYLVLLAEDKGEKFNYEGPRDAP